MISPATTKLNLRRSIAPAAFTLPELLMVVAILAILGAITAGGLAGAASRTKSDTTKNAIRRLSDAILEQYASYEDLVLTVTPPMGLTRLQHVRLLMREQMPDCWADVAPSTNIPSPTTGIGRAYQRYKQSHPVASANVAGAYESAECLYMIVAHSGLFPDFLESIRSDSVGDVDRDGRKEFLDGWGRPIAFRRWAPGFSSPLSPVQFADPANSPDPLDLNGNDPTSYALIPLIFSAGPDEATNNALGGKDGYGILDVGTSGWPTAVVTGTTAGQSPTTHPSTASVGAPNPANPTAYKDNITNHDLLIE